MARSGWLCAWILAAAWAHAQEVSFLTGANLQKQLDASVAVTWSGTPLAQSLASLSRAQRIAIVLDRRVDPDRQIELAQSLVPLRYALERIAGHLRLGYSQLGNVAYLGPLDSARRLRTVAALRQADARALGPEASRVYLQSRPMKWPELAEPRQILRQLAAEAGLDWVALERVPHDLWPAADLPPLTLVDRLTLLLAEFDLTYRAVAGGKQLQLVPLPDNVSLTRTYQVGRQGQALVAEWSKAAPGAKLTVEGNTIRAVGLVEDHEAIEQLRQGTPARRTVSGPAQEVYRLTIDLTPLAKVIDQLAARLNLQFEWNRPAIDAAQISANQLVSVHVEDANLDALLTAVFKGTGLTFSRKESAVKIFPAPRDEKPRAK